MKLPSHAAASAAVSAAVYGVTRSPTAALAALLSGIRVSYDDVALTGKIAWAHLKEFPDYYARLDKLEAEAAAYWASRG